MISSNFWELLEGFSPLFQTLLVGRMHKQSENGRFLPFIGRIGPNATNSFLDTFGGQTHRLDRFPESIIGVHRG